MSPDTDGDVATKQEELARKWDDLKQKSADKEAQIEHLIHDKKMIAEVSSI